MYENKETGGGLDFMESLIAVIGSLSVAVGVVYFVLGLIDNYSFPSGWFYGPIAIGFGLSCLAVAAVLQILKDIRTELKTLNEGVRANTT